MQPTILPNVTSLTTNRCTPTVAQEEIVINAVAMVPAPILRTLAWRGARVELVSGSTIAAHPIANGRRWSGLADRQRLRHNALHEVAHLCDDLIGRPSQGPVWQAVWNNAKRRCNLTEDDRSSAGEYLANSCARHWLGENIPHRETLEFVRSLPLRFVHNAQGNLQPRSDVPSLRHTAAGPPAERSPAEVLFESVLQYFAQRPVPVE